MRWDVRVCAYEALLGALRTVDTTAAAMAWTMLMIAINRDVQDRLQKEVDAVFESLNGVEPTYEDLHKFTYLDMVLKEGLRLFPSVPSIGRVRAGPATCDRARLHAHSPHALSLRCATLMRGQYRARPNPGVRAMPGVHRNSPRTL